MTNENINLKSIALSHNDIENLYPKTMIDPVGVAQKQIYNKLFGITGAEPKEEEAEVKEEEYVWVEGYKGTDKNMVCRDYQYELNKKFDMPEDVEIDVCHSGFHLCPQLSQVFQYYKAADGNRFFKVSALIPKSQTKRKYFNFFTLSDSDKYAAKSIIFLSECTPDEILNAAFNAKIAYANDREYLARALAKQTNISWDTRILALINSTLDMD